MIARRRRRAWRHGMITLAGTLGVIGLCAWQLKAYTDSFADLPGYRTMLTADHHGLADYRSLPPQKSIIAIGNSVSTWLDWHKLRRQLRRSTGNTAVRVVNFARPAQSPADYNVLIARNPHPGQSFYWIQAPDRVVTTNFFISTVGQSELLAPEVIRALGTDNWLREAGAAGLARAAAIQVLPGYDALTTYRRAHDYIYGSFNGLFVQRKRLRGEFPELNRHIALREEMLDLLFQRTRFPHAARPTGQLTPNRQIPSSAEQHLDQWQRILATLATQRAPGWLFFAPSRDHARERDYRKALRELLRSVSPLPFSDLGATEPATAFVDDVHMDATNRWLMRFLWQTRRQAFSTLNAPGSLREIPAEASGLRIVELPLPAAAVRFGTFVSGYAPATFLRRDVLLSYGDRLVPRVENDLAYAPEKISERYPGIGQAFNVLPNTFTLIDLEQRHELFRMWRMVAANSGEAQSSQTPNAGAGHRFLEDFRFFEWQPGPADYARLHRIFWKGQLLGEAGTQEPNMNLGAWYDLPASGNVGSAQPRIVLALPRTSAPVNADRLRAELQIDQITEWLPPAQAMRNFVQN